MEERYQKIIVSLALVTGLFAVTLPAVAGGNHGADQEHTTNGPYEISLTTHPSAEKIVPDDETVETILNVTKNGSPVESATLSYRLDAPPKTFWFGTEFPIVEGSALLQGTVNVTDGTQLFDLVYPIRGNYTLRATVSGPEGTSQKKFTIPVSGNFQEKINLTIFLLVLFLIGALGGYFLTTGRSGRQAATVLGLVGLGVFLMQPSGALAHGKGSYDPHALEKRIGTSGYTDDYDLSIRTFPQPVKVGEMLDVTYEVNATKSDGHGQHDHHGRESSEFRAEVKFIHTKGGKKFVGQPVPLHDGRANFQVQLFDGAPHYMLTKVYRAIGSPDHHGNHAVEGSDHTEKTKSDDHGHGHGVSKPWEWQGQLDLPAGTYTIKFGESGDPAMKWLLLPVGRDHREEYAAKTLTSSCESLSSGTSIAADDVCYNLKLNDDGSTHKLTVEDGGTFRLFTQHLPAEFNMTIENGAGKTMTVDREFYPGKGELILTDVRKVDVQPVQPPVDDIVKIMLTLLGVIGLGFLAGWRFKVATS